MSISSIFSPSGPVTGGAVRTRGEVRTRGGSRQEADQDKKRRTTTRIPRNRWGERGRKQGVTFRRGEDDLVCSTLGGSVWGYEKKEE
jgi:hypothetical protein